MASTIISDEEILTKGKIRLHTDREIQICYMCKGTGTHIREELTCYHKREYDYFYEHCDACDGSGLVALITKRPVVDLPYGSRLSGYEPFKPRGPKPNE